MAKIFILMIIALGLMPIDAYCRKGNEEMFVNNYLREQAVKQLELIVPRGRYTVTVNSKLKIIEDQGIRLPMGSSIFTSADLQIGAPAEPVEKMLTRVQSVEVKVEVTPDVAQPVRDLVKASLMNVLSLDTSRGDTVKVEELPVGLTQAWTLFEPKKESFSEVIKPLMTFGGLIGVIILLAAGLIAFSMRSFTLLLSGEARNLATTLKGAIENTAPALSSGLSVAASSQQQVSGLGMQAGSGESNMLDSKSSDFWEKVDIDSITAFINDCIGNPTYLSAPFVLINSLLSPDKSAKVEEKIEGIASSMMMNQSDHQMKPSDVTALFQSNQAEYRRCTRSPMGKQMISMTVAKLLPFMNDLHKFEAALLVNSLTPIKRGQLLKMLPTAYKFEMAKESKKELTMVEHKSFEFSLAEKLSKISTEKEQEANVHSMAFLSNIILKAESFEDDEALYNLYVENKENAYNGVLRALDLFVATDWETMNPNDLAMAFCGYSQPVKDKLLSFYAGKRIGEWLKNLMNKYESSKPEYMSAQVQAIHDAVKQKINSKSKNENTDSQKAAA